MKVLYISLCYVLLSCLLCNAQEDSSFMGNLHLPTRNKFLYNIFEDAKNSIRTNKFDTVDNRAVLLTQSEANFKRYQGRIIRNIDIRRFGFEKTFSDTAKTIQYFGTKLLNALHTDTKEFVIRDNLFIRKNTALDPYLIADNERYLRNLNFMQDVRMIIIPVGEDSVDILVITKDLFSLKGMLDVSGFDLDQVRGRASESNLGGTAQSLQVTGLWEKNRVPAVGYEVVYGKNNIFGSFINATMGYTNINTGRSDGNEEEYAFYMRFERPLVSAYSQLAGAMEISFNQSVNVYRKPDTAFYDYRYNLYDIWTGINLGVSDIREGVGYSSNRNRVFVSGRFLKEDFLKKPFQVGDRIDPIYNSKEMLLGQITFFKQEYYKMNYLYGFGNTEDVPTGYNVALTGGWHRQLMRDRPYAGIDIDKYRVTANGAFFHSALHAGGFYYNNRWEDLSFLFAGNFFSPLYPVKKWKMRQQIKVSYTQLINREIYFPLYLNNAYGPPNFNSSAVFGDRRVSFYTESILYLNKKIFGFLFAPFLYATASTLTPEGTRFSRSDIYPSVGGGLRTRNENLIFGTIEFKTVYFTEKVPGLQGLQFMINSDIRFRYRTNFVKAPDVVQLNFEDIY